jgi:uncharacterized membrane protein HdeD (DUF308 family)
MPVTPPPARRRDAGGPLILGLILIVLGVFFLARQLIPNLDVNLLWPIVAIVAGAVLIVAAFVRPTHRV